VTNTRTHHTFNGRLILANGTHVRVAISETDEEIVLAVIHPRASLLQDPLNGVTLESHSVHGLLRDRGSGQWLDGATIRFTRDDEPSVLQRRGHVRVLAPQPVTIRDPDDRKLLETHTVDISGSGMLLSLPPRLDLAELMSHESLDFELELKEGEPAVRGQARVVRVSPDNLQMAVEFTAITPRGRQRVIRFIFDRQRAALARTRGDWM
jgi:hypothetical protein